MGCIIMDYKESIYNRAAGIFRVLFIVQKTDEVPLKRE